MRYSSASGSPSVSGVMNAVNEGKPPLAPVLNGAFLVLAGGLLFSPGLICDAAGLLLLDPADAAAGGPMDRRRGC